MFTAVVSIVNLGKKVCCQTCMPYEILWLQSAEAVVCFQDCYAYLLKELDIVESWHGPGQKYNLLYSTTLTHPVSLCSKRNNGFVPKCAVQSSVFKIYPFQNLLAKNVPFSCEREAYSPFSKFAAIVWTCGRSLTLALAYLVYA